MEESSTSRVGGSGLRGLDPFGEGGRGIHGGCGSVDHTLCVLWCRVGGSGLRK